MLRHLGEKKAADAILQAIENVLGRKKPEEITPDMGGKAKTKDLADAIEVELKGGGVDVCMYLLACLRYALHCYDRYDVSLNA